MTERKKPSNKTIVVEALKGNVTITLQPKYKKTIEDLKGREKDFYDALLYILNDEELALGYVGYIEEIARAYDDRFVFPNDLDKIQPDQINGNLCIKFPE